MAEPKNIILSVAVETTCWEEGVPPRGQQTDILEIGVCPLNLKTRKIGEAYSYLIKPASSTISSFCTTMTGRTQHMVNKSGVAFKRAIEHIMKTYDSKTKPWASYGVHASTMVMKQCQLYETEFPFCPEHLNVKLLGNTLSYKTKNMDLPQVLEAVGLTFEGTQNRAVDAAYNIAKLLANFIENGKDQFK